MMLISFETQEPHAFIVSYVAKTDCVVIISFQNNSIKLSSHETLLNF